MQLPRLLLLLPAILLTIGSQSQPQEKQAKAQGSKAEARLYGNIKKNSASPVDSGRQELKIIPRCKCSSCPHPKERDCCPDQLTTTTDDNGHYDLALEPGTYTILVGNTKTVVTVKPGEHKLQDINIPLTKRDF